MLKKYAVASALLCAISAPALAQGMGDFRVQAMQANAFEIQSSQIALQKSRNPAIRNFANHAIRDHRAANAALAGGDMGPMAGGPGLIGAPLAVAGGAVGAATGAAAGVVGGTLSGGPVGAVEGLGSGAARGAAAGSRLGGMDVDQTAGTTMVPPSPEQQQMLAELSAAPAGARFDRLYVQQQLQAHQMTISMTQAYASTGPNPALRTYAQQALPVLQDHYAMAQRLPGAR
ncbi:MULTISPECIES: DUF4142 domain-containing protein [Methylobacterium]|uniref:DUF4142 domain-containing protein n=2 Tax=Pseudomonadota TaxID=1224 RepID=A0ABQ4SYD8_9HYPH|nr:MULTISPECIES: DUF4142 domain-containing protein [Methylobacterium]PIU04781.1 MAG: DUF305 domain-containing protein [Methylobacterium sp. CG09_land_8_20_14_0_10_71_15]PIU16257.1 MAG: DUF305 domain-containing protein [Methylobacterium sp. CG08_land_8_20_14_0_20_71_15]GBU17187.1 hypothetical protein AwMethylo_14020 [Methylobacterium sp.]GJE07897.1 hypothetical protein AOPFMNJM_3229 [Methylobacterium jeotgali]